MFFMFTIGLLCISISIVAIYVSVRQFYRQEAPIGALVRVHKNGKIARIDGIAAPGFQYLGDPHTDTVSVTSVGNPHADTVSVTSGYEYQMVRGFPPQTLSGLSFIIHTLFVWCIDRIVVEDIAELRFTEHKRIPGYPSGICVISTNTAFAGCPVLYWYPILGYWLVRWGTIDWVEQVEWVDALPSELPRYQAILKNGHVVPIQDIV